MILFIKPKCFNSPYFFPVHLLLNYCKFKKIFCYHRHQSFFDNTENFLSESKYLKVNLVFQIARLIDRFFCNCKGILVFWQFCVSNSFPFFETSLLSSGNKFEFRELKEKNFVFTDIKSSSKKALQIASLWNRQYDFSS